MKRQTRSANRAQNRILTDLGKNEILDNASFRPKIGFLKVVSSHPLTLRKPD